MRALYLTDARRLELRDAADPAVGADEVLIRVRACGICGSDVHGWDGSTGRRIPPMIMGHEAAGVVAAVGGEVDGLAEGDRVTFDSTIWCGRCRPCREGRINLCDDRRVLGVSCGEYRRDGAFAEYVAVPARVVYRLPDALSFAHAACIEPVSVAVHALRRSGAGRHHRVVVIGAGTIGACLVQVLKAGECETVLAVDPEPARRERALGFGADRACAPEELAELVGDGFDHAFEAVGAGETVGAALAALRKGGTCTLVGNLAREVPFPLQDVVTRELSVIGSCASCGEYPTCISLMAEGTVDVAPLLSEVAPLADAQGWFERLEAGEEGLGKVVLEP